MGIDIKKILTISAKDYAESVGKSLDTYKLVGINGVGSDINDFAAKIPDGVEAVVAYHFNSGVFTSKNEYYGTALIAKK